MDCQKKRTVSVYTDVDKELFLQDIYPLRRPAVLKGVQLGGCTEKWSVDYLATKGADHDVKIHVSSVPQMDFLRKNFLYRSLPFDVFVKRAAEAKHAEYFISEKESYYLRSLGEDPRKDNADIRKQFPSLAEDFLLPEFFEKEQFFSSVFRISSPGLQLWTHYDVMDNLLVQVTGRKRVVLYSPRDAPYLYLSGDKSEVLDVDHPDLNRYPEFVKARRYECCLEPGDILFIPALWFHNTLALQFGVGVNIFWRHLPPACYDRTDTYGNKDPMAAARAMQVLERALRTLEELPEEYRDFYARRMVLKIQSKAYSTLLEERDMGEAGETEGGEGRAGGNRETGGD
ncbi:tRNA wybutosine-synthesizing protein 5 isoform X1 [Acipenser ruthenus]|uniref:tRNA wybutosine-synthesizing protein 5 isoform X1 n=1 Tax=Acipenser ruthenus TaxID=7906 RepID=UPI0027409424|nr:tRNA wybutosine-synthesizing protein 5 isoform X1 [Acipenser ruthenus]